MKCNKIHFHLDVWYVKNMRMTNYLRTLNPIYKVKCIILIYQV